MKISTKHILLYIIGLSFCLKAGGQTNISIKTGQALQFDEETISRFYDIDSEYYYLLRLSNKEFIEFNTGEDAFIEVFDKELNLSKSIRLRLETNDKHKRLQPVAFCKKNDGYFVLCKLYSSANKFIRAYLLQIDESGLVENNINQLGEIGNIEPSMQNYQYFDFKKVYQNDTAKYLFILTTPPELEIVERVSLTIFSEQLDLLDERLINFPEDILDYKFSELILGSGGLIFFSLEVTNPHEPDKKMHQLIVYDIFDDQHKTWEFGFDQGEIAKTLLHRINEDQLGFMGYYSSDGKSEKPFGVFYYVFDEYNGQLLRHKIFNLPASEIDRLDPTILGSKSEYEHLYPQSIHISGDENIVLTFEYNWKSMMLIRDQEGKLYNQPYYKANEIVITNFDSTDNFVNMGIVAKQQLLNHRREHLGFFSFQKDQQLIMIYNDHPKNIDVYQSEKLKTMKTRFEHVVATYNIDNASYTKAALQSGKNPCLCDPGDIIRISRNTIVFLNKGNDLMLVEISFN